MCDNFVFFLNSIHNYKGHKISVTIQYDSSPDIMWNCFTYAVWCFIMMHKAPIICIIRRYVQLCYIILQMCNYYMVDAHVPHTTCPPLHGYPPAL